MSSTPPTTASDVFYRCANLTTVYVPQGASAAYNVLPWKSFNIVEEEGEDTFELLSTTLPSEGTPEHLYTMKSGNNYYANSTTSPTQTAANRALFAFYPSGVEGAYYIYCYTSNKWLGYTKASSYNNGRGFIVLSDTKTEGAYFKCNNYSGDNYEIAPYNTTGVASKYLNWYQGVNSSANPLDGTVTLGLWQENGATDAGSRWIFEEVTLYFITVDGIKYAVNDVTHTAKVAENTGIEGSIVIPETVEHNGSSYAVTSIGDNAFRNCTGMTGIKMLSSTPPTASSSAFSGCTSLTCIYVPKGATAAYNVAPWNSYEIVEFTDTWTISDNGAAAYTETPNFMANSLNYTRNFTHTGWQALYVPFDIPYDAISDKFDVAELNMFHQYDDNNDGDFDRTELEVLRLKAGSTIEHHTPYVIRAKAAGEQTVAVSDVTAYRAEEKEFECMSLKRRYVFHGTYSGVSGADMLAGGYYALANGELCRAASASDALGGFRWYVSVIDRATGLPVSPAALPAKMRIVEWGEESGEVTGIAAAPADAPRTAAAPVYDLNGRRVGTADAMDALPKGVYIVNGKKAIR